jgi:DNA polymerase III epsilon subunit-like protein
MGLFKAVKRGVQAAAGASPAPSYEAFGYVALDVETTSPDPTKARIVEIALIQFDHLGRRGWALHTLVNPRKRITNADIHGVTTTMVKQAPVFADIADWVARALYGRVVVGHNVAYDLTVLAGEFRHAGILLPALPAVCTMRLCHDLDLPLGAHDLVSVAAALRLPVGANHAALHDAALTSAVFASQVALVPLRGMTANDSWLGGPSPLADWLPERIGERPQPVLLARDGVALDDVRRWPHRADDAVLETLRRSKMAAVISDARTSGCPQCRQGELVVKRRRDGSGEFLSCSRYPQCRYARDR